MAISGEKKVSTNRLGKCVLKIGIQLLIGFFWVLI